MVSEDMTGTVEMRGRLPPSVIRDLRWVRYLVITMKGLRFAGSWYRAEHVPPHIANLYQLLPTLSRSKGVLATSFVRKMGRGGKAMKKALSRSYVKIVSRLRMLSDSVQDTMPEMMGEAPRWIYA
jgi:hypothetical protein